MLRICDKIDMIQRKRTGNHPTGILLLIIFSVLVSISPTWAAETPEEWGERFNTPGLELKILESRRVQEKESTKVFFYLSTNAPIDQSYKLWLHWLDGRTLMLPMEIVVNDSGYLHMLQDGERIKLELSSSKTYKGEAIQYALISNDEMIKVYADFIPHPIESTGEGGCKLSLSLLSHDRKSFFVKIRGFSEGEVVKIISRSGKEVLEDSMIITPEEMTAEVVLPAVKGKKGGKASYMVMGSQCEVSVEYEWGNEMRWP